MTTEAWVVPLTVADATTGVVTQLYPAWVPAGVAKAGSTNGQQIRCTYQGALHSIQVEPNGTDGGKIEIYDIDGADFGADVSSGTAITAAQLAVAIAANKAKLIYEQTFSGTVGSGPINAAGIFRAFMHGLAARFSNDDVAGTCKLNLVVEGGYRYTDSKGGY